MNSYKHPSNSFFGKCCNILLNQTQLMSLRRKIFSKLPFPQLTSDITDVVYLNWFVDADIAKKYIPKDVTVREYDGRVLFTILTYKHHNFGPHFTGVLRKIFPSPLQSNWRFYVDSSKFLHNPKGVVLFLKNIMDSTLYTLGSRLVSDALPSHLSKKFIHERNEIGFITKIESGIGNAPDLDVCLQFTDTPTLPPIFQNCFGNLQNALNYICMQHSAICQIPQSNQIAQAGIHLSIDINTIQHLQLLSNNIPFLNNIDKKPSEAFCFVVPKVMFDVFWERTIN